jgi:hypothetical protein
MVLIREDIARLGRIPVPFFFEVGSLSGQNGSGSFRSNAETDVRDRFRSYGMAHA